jgi:hypothetical protein
MLIMIIMLLLVIIPLAALIAALFTKGDKVRGVSGMAGFAIGAFIWNAYSYWLAWPIISVVLLVLAGIGILRLLVTGRKILLRGMMVAVTTCLFFFLAWQGGLQTILNTAKEQNPVYVNSVGQTGSALIVYHPGGSSFQSQITKGFARGLAQEGWRIKIITTGSKAVTNFKKYDLVIFSSPTYDWLPSRRIMKYIKEIPSLKEVPTAVIVSAVRSTEQSQPVLEKAVKDKGAKLVGSYVIWTSGSKRIYGIDDPVEAMRREGGKLARSREVK